MYLRNQCCGFQTEVLQSVTCFVATFSFVFLLWSKIKKVYTIYVYLCFPAVNEFRKPKIKQPLLPLSVPKNEPAVLTLVLTADHLPDVKW
jgi:hypothetical protein